MSLLGEFVRVSRRRPCPICQRIKFCLVERATQDDPDRVLCTKIESPRRWGEAGWLHVLRQGAGRPSNSVRAVCIPVSPAKFSGITARFEGAMTDERLQRLAAGLGLTSGSLRRLGAGAAIGADLEMLGTPCKSAGCWTFPMRNAGGTVIGVRLRTPDGFKYAIRGSRQGLFIPADLGAPPQLLIAEGPTDTAALLDLGFAAIGRPCCTGGTRHVVELVRRINPTSIVIVADADEFGLKGAADLALALAAYTRDVRLIRPPDGIKDARAWKNTTTNADVVARQITQAIEAAVPRRLSITTRKAGR
jgi:hypothetical protein